MLMVLKGLSKGVCVLALGRGCHIAVTSASSDHALGCLNDQFQPTPDMMDTRNTSSSDFMCCIDKPTLRELSDCLTANILHVQMLCKIVSQVLTARFAEVQNAQVVCMQIAGW